MAGAATADMAHAPGACGAAARPANALAALLRESGIEQLLAQLERELVGLAPVKQRIRDIAALLVVDKLRAERGFTAGSPSLHMCFSRNSGSGKTTVALRMAAILHRLGYVRKGHLVAVTRDDLVGQYIGHTAPKTREVLKKAMGGVRFIDEAYYLYRPENERDYGQEAIEIPLQVMENQRDDLVVILAGYKDRMDTFFRSNPGMSSRIAHHIVRNALDRARLRHASRLLNDPNAGDDDLTLITITAADLRASRIFTQFTEFTQQAAANPKETPDAERPDL